MGVSFRVVSASTPMRRTRSSRIDNARRADVYASLLWPPHPGDLLVSLAPRAGGLVRSLVEVLLVHRAHRRGASRPPQFSQISGFVREPLFVRELGLLDSMRHHGQSLRRAG